MKTSKSHTTRGGVVTLLLIGLVVGCTSIGDTPPNTDQFDTDPLQVSCELGLVRLQNLIAKRSAKGGYPVAALLEAQELHQMGKELYLEGEYKLALRLIEDGIELIEEESG